jgi:enoyl-CoA hydratase
LWHRDARIALQAQVPNLRLLSELQRFLLSNTSSCHSEAVWPRNLLSFFGKKQIPRVARNDNGLLSWWMEAHIQNPGSHYVLKYQKGCAILQLASTDRTNVLSRAKIGSLLASVQALQEEAKRNQIKALIVTGNEKFFSAGADLKEIAQLSGPEALEFSRAGQKLTQMVDSFPVTVIAAIEGYCMGGGMDLALACDFRIAAPNAVFGHRGASLGVLTGWGGTQRLPRLIGKARALQMFLLAEMVKADEALRIGLVDALADDPVQQSLARIASLSQPHLT